MGVIVGADVAQEWLLPWWWENYRAHNCLPVAFFDFGMSRSMRRWCEERGECLDLSTRGLFVAPKEEIDPRLAAEWEKGMGEKFWERRLAWFKKPFACLKSPFERTLWSDLDCEIRCRLEPLFRYAEKEPSIATVRWKDGSYNSGIVVFREEASLLRAWVDIALSSSHLFRGDEEILGHLFQKRGIAEGALPGVYNWDFKEEGHTRAEIVHWYGPIGKHAIYEEIAKY